MPNTIDDTLEASVLPTPADLVYDLTAPLGTVTEFDTDLMVAIR